VQSSSRSVNLTAQSAAELLHIEINRQFDRLLERDVFPFLVAAANGTIVADLSMLGIAGPSLKQGTARTTYFEPGGVSF